MRASLAGALVAVGLGIVVGAGRAPPTSIATPSSTSCAPPATDLGVDFAHALVVSRARSDTDVFDITTKSEIDGDMSCRAGRCCGSRRACR